MVPDNGKNPDTYRNNYNVLQSDSFPEFTDEEEKEFIRQLCGKMSQYDKSRLCKDDILCCPAEKN